jgi:hypothetical protein
VREDFSEIQLGSVLVSLLDPTPGEEVAFHRWYERDHFYAGTLIGRWFFAGRRFVATRKLKDLRHPPATPVIDDIRRGSYLALYWILEGQHREAEAWAVEQVNWLIENDRMLPSRRQAMAGFYQHRWSVFRDEDGVPASLALDHPYAGVVLEMIDRDEGVDAATLETWIRERHLPALLEDSPVAMCLGLDPMQLPDDAPSYVARPEGLDRRTLHIYFVEEDPSRRWADLFAERAKAVREAGLGSVSYAAPFIPTIPGSDRYTDELW